MSHLTDEYWVKEEEEIKNVASYFQYDFPEPSLDLSPFILNYNLKLYEDHNLLWSASALKLFRSAYKTTKFSSNDLRGKWIATSLNQENTQVVFAASIEVFIIGKYVIAYVFFMATAKKYQRKGLARNFLNELLHGARQAASLNNCNGAFVMAMSSRYYKNFYNRCKFTPAPPIFQKYWSESEFTMMMKYREPLQSTPIIEADNATLSGKKREIKYGGKQIIKEDKIKSKQSQSSDHNQEQSEAFDTISSKSSRSSQSIGGIAYDKHCDVDTCKSLFIQGKNWARHKNKVHGKQQDVPFTICQGIGCSHCAKVPKSTKPVYRCSKCGLSKRSDQFKLCGGHSLDTRICNVCTGSPKAMIKPSVFEKKNIQTTGNLLNKRTFGALTNQSTTNLPKDKACIDTEQLKDSSYEMNSPKIDPTLLVNLQNQVSEIVKNALVTQQQPTIQDKNVVYVVRDKLESELNNEQLLQQIQLKECLRLQQNLQQQQHQQSQQQLQKEEKQRKEDHKQNDSGDQTNIGSDERMNEEVEEQQQQEEKEEEEGKEEDIDESYEQKVNEQREYDPTCASLYRVVKFSDLEVVNIIEKLNDKQDVILQSLELKTVCDMFLQSLVNEYIAYDKKPELKKCLTELLKWGDQLNADQKAGLIGAVFRIPEGIWMGVIEMLSFMVEEQRIFVLDVFIVYLKRFGLTNDVADWIHDHWQHLGEQQIKLLHAWFFRKKIPINNFGLTLSRVVIIPDVNDGSFQLLVTNLEESLVSGLLTEAIIKNMDQSQVDFTTFLKIIQCIHNAAYSKVISDKQNELKQTPIHKWVDFITLAQQKVGIANANSVTQFLTQLKKEYGDIKQLSTDLIQSDDDRFPMFIEMVQNVPNNKQFALAQYCVGNLYVQQRQLWNVPSGQGKGRIEHTIAYIALTLGIYQKVYMVFNNEQLLKRDKSDFETYIQLLDDPSSVEYSVGYDFAPEETSLVIVDEADTFIYSEPEKFRSFVANTACICFTATPGDEDGVDIKVMNALKIKRYQYILGAQQQFNFNFNAELVAPTIQEKADYIKDYSSKSPVLVYCNEDLRDLLKEMGLPVIIVDEKVDHDTLRVLDIPVSNGQFNIAVGTTMFAMRGIDYRSASVDMALFIVKSFNNKREAIQGFQRVGRYTDKCSRIAFKDIPLLDTQAKRAHDVQCYKFVAGMQRKVMLLKQVKVKQIAPPNNKSQQNQFQGKCYNTSLSTSRVTALLEGTNLKSQISWERKFDTEQSDVQQDENQ